MVQVVSPLGTSRRAFATMQTRERVMRESPTKRAHCPVHMMRWLDRLWVKVSPEASGEENKPGARSKGQERGVAETRQARSMIGEKQETQAKRR